MQFRPIGPWRGGDARYGFARTLGTEPEIADGREARAIFKAELAQLPIESADLLLSIDTCQQIVDGYFLSVIAGA